MLGKTHQNRILVGYGEDSPSEFVDWLEDLVNDYQYIESEAEIIGLNLSTYTLCDFLSAIGLDVQTESIERECCDGKAIYCWMKKGTLRATKTKAKSLIQTLESKLNKVDTEDLYGSLLDAHLQLEKLTSQLSQEKERHRSLIQSHHREIEQFKEQQVESDRIHAKLLELMNERPDNPIFIGPFLFKRDKVIAITEVSGVSMPDGFFRAFLKTLKERLCDQQISEVKATVDYVAGYCPRRSMYKPTSLRDWERFWTKIKSTITPRYTFTFKVECPIDNFEEIARTQLKSGIHISIEE